MRCIYLSMDSLGDYVSDAALSVPAMEDAGWTVEHVSWRDKAFDWSTADLVYICTPWDYHEHLDEFLSALERIERSGAMLVNPLDIVRWNANKTYLRELEERGTPIVASLWFDAFDSSVFPDAAAQFGTERMVIKPTVGASALDTFVITGAPDDETVRMLETTYDRRPFFIQPFVKSVQTTGEYSLFFFDGEYSHTILKTPKSGDFRTQEEHGSNIQSVGCDDDLYVAAEALIRSIDTPLAYARVDLVRDDYLKPRLMELELIEPSLYFRTDPSSPKRFAKAMTTYYRRESQR